MFFSLYVSTSFRLQIRIVQGCAGQFPMVAESNNEHSWYLHHNLSYLLSWCWPSHHAIEGNAFAVWMS